eukprot:scaffold39541_cov49-Phaeocystis_antarctica.AAC.2
MGLVVRAKGRAEGVEAHQPVAAVVEPRQLVALTVADLEARHAVGGHRASGDELLVDGGRDALQRAQGVGLDLDRPAVRRVRGRLLEDRHLHAERVAGGGGDQAREAPSRDEHGERVLLRHGPAALGRVALRAPPGVGVLLADEHAAQLDRVRRRLLEAAPDPVRALLVLGDALRRLGLRKDLLDVLGHVDLVPRGALATGEPLHLRQLLLELADHGRRTERLRLLADDHRDGTGSRAVRASGRRCVQAGQEGERVPTEQETRHHGCVRATMSRWSRGRSRCLDFDGSQTNEEGPSNKTTSSNGK